MQPRTIEAHTDDIDVGTDYGIVRSVRYLLRPPFTRSRWPIYLTPDFVFKGYSVLSFVLIRCRVAIIAESSPISSVCEVSTTKMLANFSFLDVGALCLTIFFLDRLLRQRKHTAPLPPGPRGLPLIGNLLDIPTTYQWKCFAKWSEKWGDIVAVHMPGQTMIILNKRKDAVELFERRSANFSDRAKLLVTGEIMGWNTLPGLAPYGQRWREHRRLYAQYLASRERVANFLPIVEMEVLRFLLNLLNDSDNVDVRKHARTTTVAIGLQVTHGYQMKDPEDPLLKLVVKVMDEFDYCVTPGAFLADTFPSLMYVPDWMPGTGWKRNLKAWTKDLFDMYDIPVEYVKQQMCAGTAKPSFTATYLNGNIDDEREEIIKQAAGGIFAGAADTTVSSVGSFFFAMVLHPEIQKKAQAEIDAVIGHDRIPRFADRDDLPYVSALYLEVMRWNPVAPLSIPHRAHEDDVYKGFFIPKGAIMIPNTWQYLHDPEIHENPHAFKPERFLRTPAHEPEANPMDAAFGYGRRICPGIQLADALIFLSCVMTLAFFDISKGDNFPDIEPTDAHAHYTTGIVSHPPPFKCRITPRSSSAEALLQTTTLYV